MNKKGIESGYASAGDGLKMLYLLFFATGMAVGLSMLVNIHISGILTAEDHVDTLLTREAVRNCFLHKSEGRVYYQTVNPKLITEENLKKCLPSIPADAKLLDLSNKEIASTTEGEARGNPYSYKINVLGSDELFNLVVFTQ